jgi:aerobic carbon-monoxide dehydrogenase large subunit
MPIAGFMPPILSALKEVPATTNPLGVEGIGQAGNAGVPPTIINAVVDALQPIGVSEISMPATVQRVSQQLQTSSAASGARRGPT